jgi:hypothetical protein
MQQGLEIPGDANERRRIQCNLKVLDTVSWVTSNCVASSAPLLVVSPIFTNTVAKPLKVPSICGADLGAII